MDNPARPVRGWDIALTVILLVLLAGVSALTSFFGFFLAMAGDPCGVRDCSTDLIATGMITAIALPWAVLLVAVAVAVILLATRRIAFWVPLVAFPLVAGSWLLGALIASAGVPAG